ncbi:unnamed protein product [marine sediment metagenome]|uniref:Uncharacterized protein n=1 Tax=marine sediment metagenome TaxID=412755 RepID=X1F9Z8_9ZZZZ
MFRQWRNRNKIYRQILRLNDLVLDFTLAQRTYTLRLQSLFQKHAAVGSYMALLMNMGVDLRSIVGFTQDMRDYLEDTSQRQAQYANDMSDAFGELKRLYE